MHGRHRAWGPPMRACRHAPPLRVHPAECLPCCLHRADRSATTSVESEVRRFVSQEVSEGGSSALRHAGRVSRAAHGPAHAHWHVT